MRALDAELYTLFCSVFDILLLVESSFATLSQWFTVGNMSCGKLQSDGPFDWNDTEECTRLTQFNAAFLGWLG